MLLEKRLFSFSFPTHRSHYFLGILGLAERILSAKADWDVAAIITGVESIHRALEFKMNDRFVKCPPGPAHGSRKPALAFSDCQSSISPFDSKLTKLQGMFDPIMSEPSQDDRLISGPTAIAKPRWKLRGTRS